MNAHGALKSFNDSPENSQFCPAFSPYLLDGTDKNAMDGIVTLDKIKAFDVNIPVVMLSAQDKIDVAVNCMHHQAFDYVVKSETAFIRLQKIINAVFHLRKIEKELVWYMQRM